MQSPPQEPGGALPAATEQQIPGKLSLQPPVSASLSGDSNDDSDDISDKDTQSNYSEDSTPDVFPRKESITLAGNSNLICQLDGSSSKDNSIQNVTNVTNCTLPTICLDTTGERDIGMNMNERILEAGRSTKMCQLVLTSQSQV